MLAPTGDYERRSPPSLDELGQYDESTHDGPTNIEALDGYACWTSDAPTPPAGARGLDYEAAQVVYAAYAAAFRISSGNSPPTKSRSSICSFGLRAGGRFDAATSRRQMPPGCREVQMNSAKAQLQGTDYDRMLVHHASNFGSSDETYAFTRRQILEIAERLPDENVYSCGRPDERIRIRKSFCRG